MVSVSGAASLMRRAGSNHPKRSNRRGLVASCAIPASTSESHNHIYSAIIVLRLILHNCTVLDWENF